MNYLNKNSLVVAVLATGLALTGSSQAHQNEPVRSATIDAQSNLLIMVNVLTPARGKQAETIRLLQAGMEETMSKQPGFISATIHGSRDSEHVVVYAQWKDQNSVDSAVKLIQNGKAPNMMKVFSIANPDFHPYRVESVHVSKKIQ